MYVWTIPHIRADHPHGASSSTYTCALHRKTFSRHQNPKYKSTNNSSRFDGWRESNCAPLHTLPPRRSVATTYATYTRQRPCNVVEFLFFSSQPTRIVIAGIASGIAVWTVNNFGFREKCLIYVYIVKRKTVVW